MPAYRTVECIQCGTKKNQPTSTMGVYCSNKCQAQHTADKIVKRWLSGEDSGYTGKLLNLKRSVRNYLLETRGEKCEQCGWDKKHPVDNRPILNVDHIDGDAKNNRPDNLRILCPNCHAMTSTFGNRNKKSSRERR